MTHTSVSRRGFVGGCMALAGIAALGLGQVPAVQASKAAETCDILVVGGGIVGALAALSAQDAGAESVILCEKMGFVGGSAALSSGFMVTVENSNFADEIDDSWEKMESVLHETHDQSPDREFPTWDRLSNLFHEQSATIDFMVNLGMTAEFGEKSTAVTMWDGKGAGMMDALAKAMDERGIDVRCDCPTTDLVVEDGAVVEAKDGASTVRAGKVLLTCGGASHNTEILHEYMSTLANVDLDNQSAAGNTGDGFVMCEKLGAPLYPSISLEEGGCSVDNEWKRESGFRLSVNDKLIVDATGARFANESPSGSAGQILVYAMVQHGSPKYFCIYDAAMVDEDGQKALETGVEMGCVFFGTTPEEMAEAAGMEPATFAETFQTYQDACTTGEDAAFGKPADNLAAYDPADGLYAVYIRPGSWGTIGGVVTDDTFHVLDEAGQPIANLFAAGEMSNREFFSDFYIGGNSLALNSTAGRIAGATAVAEL